MGQVYTGGVGQNPDRQAAINAGLPIEKTAYLINQVCGSGLRSVAAGYQSIISNDSKIIIAGGQESMSNANHITLRQHQARDEGSNSMMKDGLYDAFNNYHMGVTAENVAEKWGISRKEQDDFALSSQLKTEKSSKEKKFKDEIVTVSIKNKKIRFAKDEHPRGGMTLERLSKLKPAFKKMVQ